MPNDMITIGELAAMTRLSPEALRLYGDRGLGERGRDDGAAPARVRAPGAGTRYEGEGTREREGARS
ncbi:MULTISPECIES: MerR family DNA-binding transcriptional regulator [Streptomyces]|uniref:HTH merR-type domain-containing protein n=2 Tax=Streptomyces TaxID=1883 RepID=A0ABU4KGA1_9ACTN|nr:MerR family DNA-binding transcriptional regulator [Streptomyces roseolus]MDX2296804.1 hypothetical protein [Streptomyces roseolus]